MSGTSVCVTNDIRDLRPCVVKGAHKSNCDGWARRYDRESEQTILAYSITYNAEEGVNERFLIECGGCLPRKATTGLLCESHVMKLEHALDHDTASHRVLVDLVTHMWSIQSGGVRDDNDKIAAAFGSRWTLSESHIQANAVYMELAATAVAFAIDLRIPEPEFSAAASIMSGFAIDLDVDIVGVITRRLVDWLEEHYPAAVKRRHSAEAVVRMIGVVQTALAKFPLTDLEHRVPFVRCPGCARMTLTWKPPLYYEDEVIVKCERCGHEEDQDWLEFYIQTVKTDDRRLGA